MVLTSRPVGIVWEKVPFDSPFRWERFPHETLSKPCARNFDMAGEGIVSRDEGVLGGNRLSATVRLSAGELGIFYAGEGGKLDTFYTESIVKGRENGGYV